MPTSKQRRTAERRRLRRQAERRQQQQVRRRRLNVVVSVIGVLVVVGVFITLLTVTNGSDSSSKAEPTPAGSSTTPSTSAAAAPSSSAATTSAAKTSTANTSTANTSTANTSTANTSTANTSTANTSTARTSAARTTSAAPAAAAVTTCRYPTAGTAARKVAKPSASATATGTVTLRLGTSQGAVIITLNRTAAPCAVNSVVSLARQKYYTGTSCHRLVNKSIFVLQCGDPTGTGRGGPGYSFADELGSGTLFRRGSVVMANGGPNTNGSQFFIVDRDTQLGAYTPLGTVTSGLSVADKVYRAGTSDGSSDGPPELRFTFRTVSVG